MKKFLIALIIIIPGIIPVLASDWVGWDGLLFDNDSISKYGNYPYNSQDVYSIWIQYEYENLKYGKTITAKWQQLYPTMKTSKFQYLVNCDNKTIALKHVVHYDSELNSLDSMQYDDMKLDWQTIIPDSQGDMWYMLVCKAYKQSLKNKN